MNIPIGQISIVEHTPDIDEEQLVALTESMREHGLSHPIILRPANQLEGLPGSEPLQGYELASGERRLLAAIRLGWTEIKAEVRDITKDQALEIRINENLRRFNLPWWEQVTLTEKLHNMRQATHGVATRGRPARDEVKTGWTIRDTAEELGIGVGNLSEDLTLARALQYDKSLMKVKDKKTAIKLVRIAAQRHQSEMEANRPTTFEGNEVYFGDSASILSQLPPHSIDACITDPPWIRFFEASLRIDERTLPVFKELYRVLKNPAMLYLVCGLDDYHYYAGHDEPDPNNPQEKIHVRGALESIGFQVANTPLIWKKLNSLSRRGVRPWEYDRDFEFIIVAAKGSPALTSARRLSGIKEFAIVPPTKMIHQNEKPMALIEELIEDCSYEGNIIVDPFGGSGVLAEACKKKNRKYIVCEREKKYYDGIVKRLGA